RFSARTCVLKWSGDDVGDRRHEACCTSDGGGPSGFAVQAEIPNHRKLRRLRAGVVSVAVEVPWVAGQVGDEKTNVCEPLLTHRNKQRRLSGPAFFGPGFHWSLCCFLAFQPGVVNFLRCAVSES